MAGYPNKIIINSGGNSGTSALIESDLEVLDALAGEVIALDMLKETVDLRDNMKGLCDDHYKAQMVYHDGLKKLIQETAERIDRKAGLP